MIDPHRKNPMLGGSLLCMGAVLVVISSYFFFDDVVDKPAAERLMLIRAGSGYLLWIIGSVLMAQARFSSALAGFICGLLFVPGLIILLTVIPTRNRLEIWQDANPGFTQRDQKRQYRDFKSLY